MDTKRWQALFWIALAQVLGMSLWFSASAALPSLKGELNIGPGGEAGLTIAVQLGFVAGTFLSALFSLADFLNTRRFFIGSMIAGGVFNALILPAHSNLATVLLLRFLTGVSLAGVYPPGMKLVAGWFVERRGLAIGTLIGALTIGSASPHLVRALGSPSWQTVILTSSLLALAGAAVSVFFIVEGPYNSQAARLNLKLAAELLKRRSLRLTNYGYIGHMWELYAMWAWIPFFLESSFQKSGGASGTHWSGPFWGFTVIAVGIAGCVLAGAMADRWGRTWVAGGAMLVSGVCCLVVGSFWGGSEVWLVAVCLIWGISVVADSAQFSAMASELVPSEAIGTALTLQTCLGFLLTVTTIWLLPYIRDGLGWNRAFLLLAPGPFLGVLAMARLHHLHEAAVIAGRKQN